MSCERKFAQLLFGSDDLAKIEYFENLALCFDDRERVYEIINLDIATSIPEDSVFLGVDIRSVIEFESENVSNISDIYEQQANAIRNVMENEEWTKTAFLEPTSNYIIINFPGSLEIPVFDSSYKNLLIFLRENEFNLVEINFLDANMFQTPNDFISAQFTFAAISTSHEYSGMPILNALVNMHCITNKKAKKCGKIINMSPEELLEQTIQPIQAITNSALALFSNFNDICQFKTLDFYDNEELHSFIEIIDELLDYDPSYDSRVSDHIPSDVSDDMLIIRPFGLESGINDDEY